MATGYEYGFSNAPTFVSDKAIVERIASAFLVASMAFSGHGTSFWARFDGHNAGIRDAIKSGNLTNLADILRNPAAGMYIYGYDGLFSERLAVLHKEAAEREREALADYEALVQVCIGVGAVRLPYPEGGQSPVTIPVEELLIRLDERMGVTIEFPNPFPNEFGLLTSRGVACYRAIQAIYQAWRIKLLLNWLGAKSVLEIGAGMGRTAYYARQLGVSDFTIVDIPTTEVAQAYFLARTLGEEHVSLPGESPHIDGVKLATPSTLHASSQKFGLSVNVDSLTEMDREHALAYVLHAQKHARAFLSVNHEFNGATVAELLNEAGMPPVTRSPYWPRAGYVEELAINRS